MVPLVEQELLHYPQYLRSAPDFRGVHIAQTIMLCVGHCMSFFLLLWYCLSFFDVTSITITYLISSHVVSRIKPLSTIFQLYHGGHRSTVSQYSSLSYIYLCNKCLSSTKVAGSILIMSRCTRHNILVFNIIV